MGVFWQISDKICGLGCSKCSTRKNRCRTGSYEAINSFFIEKMPQIETKIELQIRKDQIFDIFLQLCQIFDELAGLEC